MAIEYIVRLKNDTTADLLIEDLGFVLQGLEDNLSSDQFSYSQLCDSEDLKDLVNSGDVVVNDGTEDLTISEAIKFLTRENKYNLEKDYYNKTQLQTEGQSSVNQANITNAPSFGSPSQIKPVRYRVVSVDASAPAVGATGSVYVNTTSNKYFKSDGTAWVDVGNVAAGERIVVLNNSEESIFEYSGSAQTITDNPLVDNYAVVVDDDGDGKQSQYVYNVSTTEWIKIGDIDFGPHIDGGSNKHTATQISVVNNLPAVDTTAGESVEQALIDIDNKIDSMDNDISTLITDVNNAESAITNLQSDVSGLDTRLDTAETDIGSLETTVGNIGTSITNLQNFDTTAATRLNTLETDVGTLQTNVGDIQTDIGVIEGRLDNLDTTIASLLSEDQALNGRIDTVEIDINAVESDVILIQNALTDLTSADTALDGRLDIVETKLSDFSVISGRVYGKDTTRSKQLGSSESIIFSKSSAAKNTYLRTSDIASNVTGVRLHRNMTLIAATAEISASGSCEFRVRKNNTATDLAVITITASTGVTVTNLNVDFNASDVLEVYCTCPGTTVNNPVLRLVVAENGGAI